ncbi:triose-phosphate isomerase [Patescibacteria group bacterium]|nr:triose-phosphate isomerase [Patescibacteria group bacterium]MBU2219379.1 triose-phosphate isomerase [Patescibacteria group bacterium]MBU2263344.1 triose-phosphate isomerase [Patescibacteria group bacterium]
MKKLIIANWKMNPQGLKEARRIFSEIKKVASRMPRVETIICPPCVYLSLFGDSISKRRLNLRLGAQNVFWENPSAGGGAYTGEISAQMLKNLNVKYVIIGHSERRKYLGETDEMINKKIKNALNNNLKVIFCIGEQERDIEGSYLYFIKNEIEAGLKNIPRKLFKNLIIAYEPIWAINKKGKDADKPEDVFQISIYIRRVLLGIMGKELSRSIPILYGGSVEPENAENILKEGGVQGFLVGHASLVPRDFNKILKIAQSVK